MYSKERKLLLLINVSPVFRAKQFRDFKGPVPNFMRVNVTKERSTFSIAVPMLSFIRAVFSSSEKNFVLESC